MLFFTLFFFKYWDTIVFCCILFDKIKPLTGLLGWTVNFSERKVAFWCCFFAEAQNIIKNVFTVTKEVSTERRNK